MGARADLIAHWDFPSAAKSGQDESGQGNNLVISGSGVSFTTSGKVGAGGL